MKILLDTHVVLWAASGSPRLAQRAQQLVEDIDNECFVSAVTLWEVALKTGLGRAEFSVDPHRPESALTHAGYLSLPGTSAHAVRVFDLEPLHSDPFDPMLIAQAEVEQIPLVTADPAIARYRRPYVFFVGQPPA